MNVNESIKKHEGYSPTIYDDSVGVPTLGFGFNLLEPMPKPVAELWLAILIVRHEKELQEYHWYNSLDPVRQDALLDMHYNLGDAKFREFKKMIRALANKKYDEAAKEMLDSKWASQVGDRATELASIMINGANTSTR